MGLKIDQVQQWRAPLLHARQRRLLVWQGERSSGLNLGAQLAAQLPRHLILTDQPVVDAQPISAGKRWLGRELDLVILDGWAGFDPESFGALSGALVAGGLLLLIIPPNWSGYPDPDYQRIAPWPHTKADIQGRFILRIEQLLRSDPTVLWWHDPSQLPALTGHLDPVAPPQTDGLGALSKDQGDAVKALLQLDAPPQVLIADRGRGKSAALGLAIAAHLQGARPLQIILTAPRKSAVAAALALARSRLGLEAEAPLVWGDNRCTFMAPDQLLASVEEADLLLVDEAAAIPVPLLKALLQRQLAKSCAIAFSTTVHGYEGTGRGFSIRFRQTLSQQAPDWRSMTLQTPIRWADDDPLEPLCFRSLLLAAEPDTLPESALTATSAMCDELSIERLDRGALALDEALLGSLFGLLVQAHYQTSPNDLRQLLDSPGQSVWVVHSQGKVIATALTVTEGGFDRSLARSIWAGQRRPRGHLLAQSLAAHGGWLLAPRLHGVRIMRIAVAAECQRQGVGARLVQAIEQAAVKEGADWLGSSFSASAELVTFWQGLGLLPVRLGVARDACSGSYALNVLKGLSSRGCTLAAAAGARFNSHWPPVTQQLEPTLFSALTPACSFPSAPDAGPNFSERQNWLDLLAFAHGLRAFETVEPQLIGLSNRLVLHREAERRLVQAKLIDHRSWPDAAVVAGFSGKKAAQHALRALVARYLEEQLPARWWPLRRALQVAAVKKQNNG